MIANHKKPWRTAHYIYLYARASAWTMWPNAAYLTPIEWWTLNHIARMGSSHEVEHAYWPLIEAAG